VQDISLLEISDVLKCGFSCNILMLQIYNIYFNYLVSGLVLVQFVNNKIFRMPKVLSA